MSVLPSVEPLHPTSPDPTPCKACITISFIQYIDIGELAPEPISFSRLQIYLWRCISELVIPLSNIPLPWHPCQISCRLNHFETSQNQRPIVIDNGICVVPINNIFKRSDISLRVPLDIYCILSWIKWHVSLSVGS